ncbi:MAG: SprB repeat-containing protein, partial [Bacteroidota bacterium]
MKNKNTYLSLRGIMGTILLLCLSTTAFADFVVVQTTNSGINPCYGTITLVAEGAAGPFTIQVVDDLGNFTQVVNVNGEVTIEGRCAGSHTITVIDAFGCESILPKAKIFSCHFTIGEPEIQDPPMSCTDNDGRIVFLNGNNFLQSGLPPYTGGWTDQNGNAVAGWNELSGLTAGIYTLSITDANGCRASKSITLNGEILPASETVTTPACMGQSDGWIASVFNGVYHYTWSNGLTGTDHHSILTDLAPGIYSVTLVPTSGNCPPVVEQHIVSERTSTGPFQIINSEITPTCLGSDEGAIELQVDGGFPGGFGQYQYRWSDGRSGNRISNLSVGHYCVTITDLCNQQLSECFEVDPPLQTDLSITADVYPGNELGSIDVFVDGGNGTYSYLWETGATSQDLHNLISGNYQLTVTDVLSGCTQTAEFYVCNCYSICIPFLPTHVPEPLILETSPDEVVNGSCTSNYTLSINELRESRPPYTLVVESVNNDYQEVYRGTFAQAFSLANGDPPVSMNLAAGRYLVKAFDACGNMNSKTVDLCSYCGYEYDGENQEYLFGSLGVGNGEAHSLILDLEDDCASDRSLTIKGDHHLLFGFSYQVIWPDGQQSIVNSVGVSGIETYDLGSEPGEYIITVIRNGGECVIELPIT